MKILNWLFGSRRSGMPKFENPPPPPPYASLEPTLVQLLDNTDWRTLVLWYSELNCWGWPQELLPEEDPQQTRDGGRRRCIMNFIDQKVGHQTILKYLNVNVDGRMTHDEFDDFWQYTRNHCKHAEKRYHEAARQRREKE